MAVTQNSTITVQVDASMTSSNDLSNTVDRILKSYATALTNGTGDGNANMIWHDQRTLAASATEDLDFAASLTSTLTGATLTFTKIKAIIVKAAAANTNNVNVIEPASSGLVLFLAASDGIAVRPDGLFMLTAPKAGVTVTATSGDLLTFTNSGSGTSVTYDVIVFGTI
jgi:hypothetical protein